MKDDLGQNHIFLFLFRACRLWLLTSELCFQLWTSFGEQLFVDSELCWALLSRKVSSRGVRQNLDGILCFRVFLPVLVLLMKVLSYWISSETWCIFEAHLSCAWEWFGRKDRKSFRAEANEHSLIFVENPARRMRSTEDQRATKSNRKKEVKNIVKRFIDCFYKVECSKRDAKWFD